MEEQADRAERAEKAEHYRDEGVNFVKLGRYSETVSSFDNIDSPVPYRELNTPSLGCSSSKYLPHLKEAAGTFCWSRLLHSE